MTKSRNYNLQDMVDAMNEKQIDHTEYDQWLDENEESLKEEYLILMKEDFEEFCQQQFEMEE